MTLFMRDEEKREEGRAEGREEVRIEERKQRVTNALKKGKSVAEVADLLGLTEEEVKAIQDEVYSMA